MPCRITTAPGQSQPVELDEALGTTRDDEAVPQRAILTQPAGFPDPASLRIGAQRETRHVLPPLRLCSRVRDLAFPAPSSVGLRKLVSRLLRSHLIPEHEPADPWRSLQPIQFSHYCSSCGNLRYVAPRQLFAVSPIEGRPIEGRPIEGRYVARLMRQPSHHTRLPLRPLRGSYESVVRRYSHLAVRRHHSCCRDEHHVARRGTGSAGAGIITG
jgi:hypothetical protein